MPKASSTRKYFRGEADFWRDVYDSERVEGAIYGLRAEVAMGRIDSLPLRPGARVLEIGCGAGRQSVALARRGFEVVSTDLVEELLGMTRERAREEAPRASVRTACSDAGRLPFRSGSFDAVLALAIMEWVESPEQALAEIARVLRPGGYAVFSSTNVFGLQRFLDPRLNPLWEPLKRQAKRISRSLGSSARARTHSASEMNRLVSGAGLARMDGTTAGYGPFTLFKFRLLPGRSGRRVHEFLQRAAGAGAPLLDRLGYSHVVVARRPAAVLEIGRTPTRELAAAGVSGR
jgi:ubiquinone/menaquinone biosynthesis C-methylase UbiE